MNKPTKEHLIFILKSHYRAFQANTTFIRRSNEESYQTHRDVEKKCKKIKKEHIRQNLIVSSFPLYLPKANSTDTTLFVIHKIQTKYAQQCQVGMHCWIIQHEYFLFFNQVVVYLTGVPCKYLYTMPQRRVYVWKKTLWTCCN